MRRVLFIGFCLVCRLGSASEKIKVLFTAALLGDKDRVHRYEKNIYLLQKYGLDVYIVESCSSYPTILDTFCKNVCYTHSNQSQYSKSFNEAQSMRIGMDYFQFDPDDIIIKITGRYVLETDAFIKMIQQNMHMDVMARAFNDSDAYTGLFAIKTKVFLDFLDHYFLNLVLANQDYAQHYCIEHAFGNYLSQNKNLLNIVYIPKLYSYLPESLGRR